MLVMFTAAVLLAFRLTSHNISSVTRHTMQHLLVSHAQSVFIRASHCFQKTDNPRSLVHLKYCWTTRFIAFWYLIKWRKWVCTALPFFFCVIWCWQRPCTSILESWRKNVSLKRFLKTCLWPVRPAEERFNSKTATIVKLKLYIWILFNSGC